MPDRRSEDRLYTAIVSAFLVALVALGLLGIPAPLVAAIGALAAALAIALFHGRLEARRGVLPRRQGKRSPVPGKYVPSVLEGSSMRRRHTVHLRRRKNGPTSLRLR